MGVVVEIGLFWFFGSPLANFFPIFIKIKLEVKFITVSDICSVFLEFFVFCSADARFSMFFGACRHDQYVIVVTSFLLCSAANIDNFDRLDVLDRQLYGLQILCGTICGTMHRLCTRDWFSRYFLFFPQF